MPASASKIQNEPIDVSRETFGEIYLVQELTEPEGHHSPNYFGHKCALATDVCRPIVTELQSERCLQLTVYIRFLGVSAEIVSKRQVLLKPGGQI